MHFKSNQSLLIFFLLALLFLFCCSTLLPCCLPSLPYCSFPCYIHYRASPFSCLTPIEITPCSSCIAPCYSCTLLLIVYCISLTHLTLLTSCLFTRIVLLFMLFCCSHLATFATLLFAPCYFRCLAIRALLLLKLHPATYALLLCHRCPTITPCCSPFLGTSYPSPIVASLPCCSLSRLVVMPCQLVFPPHSLVQVEELGTTPTSVIQQQRYLFFQIS